VKPRARPAAQSTPREAQPAVTTIPRVLGGEASGGGAAVSRAPSAESVPTQTATAPRKSESASSRRAARERARQSQPSTGATFDTSE
jgi:hypothetical protein